ncbi:2-oxoglutarate and iron-dependent oxygenase JMJD4 isoform X2 [Macaca thibetana thibetana]|uniref:2-oxoglutarate and iron-dependent oxygenase JMJD4 isoform X7 n=1 Tax=Macaca fascicularis TaxID=9541 RepID=UPI001E258CCE|nr:2-oxoglutarate and iron-dependent oxygenase JMJD4 isoform X4 [Macaca fascicularis]XP_050613937.1 2-oxoglutarate and iron-dependent oxygenase JMJD4 isoform X2 [Macaca thibetana thibetana]
MDRETLALADRHFRGLGGGVPGVGQAPGRVAFVSEPGAFSYADFVRGFLLPNLPCVFSSAFTQGWGSRRRWVTPAGRPDFDHLLRTYGDVVVPVANCGVQEYNSNPKEHMPLRDYITYWKEYIEGGYSSPRGCLYLKDWHLCRDFPVEDVFTLPVYFSSDWLNEFWDALDVDDYRFVYAGPAGSWSPFHADIFRSFSWSVNVCGRKKWLLFPPGQEEALRDRHGNLPYDVTSPALCDTHLHPRSQLAGPPLEITQEAGEMVFVPSGWHHQVHNLDDTISINHNWVNGFNLANMWRFLQQELCAVQEEVIMRSCSGINFEEFYHFLKVIAEKRLLVLREAAAEDGAGLGFEQAAFDAGRITEVLASLVAHPSFQRVDTSAFSLRPKELLQQLREAVDAAVAP